MKFDNITLRDIICRPSEIDSELRELERLKSSSSLNTYIFGAVGVGIRHSKTLNG